jgi:cobalt-zinc-cadmium efflux system outer membrane protein
MRALALGLLFIACTLCDTARLRAQDSSDQLNERPAPGAPPSFERRRGDAIIGGRPGSMRPRVPITTRPAGPSHVAPSPPSALQPEVIRPSLVLPNSRAILFEAEDQGPPDGLTIEQAIERLLVASIPLRARALDIPQAQADALTAGLHANPVVYMDGQLLPYKAYNSTTNPGGPAQYDFNLAYPADLSGKRQARIEVANSAERVVEALYQDSVRQEVARLGSAYVDALAARMAVRTIRAGMLRIDEVSARVTAEPKDPKQSEVLRRQVALQRQTAMLGLVDAEMALRATKRSLAMMLDMPPSYDVSSWELRGTVKDMAPWAPPIERLRTLALTNRPDLAAYRLGLQRAGADVRLSRANRLPDVYLLYQPLTYQDLTPFGASASRSWAAGATVVLPIFDRNQGNIRRAEVNVQQTRLEMQALERRITNEVDTAFDEYLATRRAIEEFERNLLPEAEKMRHEHIEHFRTGTLDAADYLVAERELDDLGRQYRDLLVRHRRSMLNLNSAVGVRILP